MESIAAVLLGSAFEQLGLSEVVESGFLRVGATLVEDLILSDLEDC